MPGNFEYKDIRTLLNREKSYLDQNRQFEKKEDDFKNQIRNLLNNETGKNISADFIRNEAVFHHGNVFYNTDSVNELLKLVYRYVLLYDAKKNSEKTRTHLERIKDALAKASIASNFIRWTFANKEKQNEALKAAEFLNSDLTAQFHEDIDGIQRCIASLEKVDTSDAWEAYEHSYNPFIEVLFDKKEFGPVRGERIREFRDIIAKADQINAAYSQLNRQIRPLKDNIRRAIDVLKNEETLRILDTMSVDELSKEYSGIRYKALKDAGYTAIGRIYSANESDLSSIRGISDETAVHLKEIVTDIYHSTFESTRLKLSADNKTFASTELVKAVYAYQEYRTGANRAKQFFAQKSNDIERAKKYLSQIDSSIRWIFYSDEVKKNTDHSYHWLKETLEGEACRALLKLSNEMNRSHQINPVDAWDDFAKNPILYTNILEEIMPGLFSEDQYYGIPEELAKEIQDEAFFPDGLLCELRRYQEWGVKYTLHQKKVLLGDEMGLGKTVQSIAAMVSLKNTGAKHFMVICPASVLTNWCRETATKSRLSVKKIHGSERDKMFASWKRYGGVAVTTYETTANLFFEDDFRMDMLIVDEAHYIKNENARRSQNVRNICTHTDRILFLTGTAIENNVEEMISLIKVLNPEIAESLEHVSRLSAAAKFREFIAPVYYRRKREDVLGELPELIENEEWISLNLIERQIYNDTILSQKYADIRQVSWNVDDVTDSSKAQRLIELVNEAESEGRKVIVFSFFLNTLKMVREALGERCVNTINGSVPVAKRQQIIDAFDKARPGAVLPAQIQSGGTGLNIQSASVVIMCEPQLKPSIENQAISRAYRMGQARNVLVYRLLCENTIEERIMERLSAKQLIFDSFADTSVAAERSQEIDERTFGSLIQLEIDQINQQKLSQS